MIDVRRTVEFDEWLNGLRDQRTRLRLARRLERLQGGNFGDHKPVGGGVVELREHFGPGWRMYLVRRGDTVVVMLGGGDKSDQAGDIAAAIELAEQLED